MLNSKVLRSLPGLAALFAILVASISLQPRAEAALEQEIMQASSEGKNAFRFPQGVVKLKHGLLLKGLRNFTLDGAGTTLVCTDPRAWALRFEDCSGLTIRGLTIDYDPLPFTQGTVMARADDASWFDVALHDGYPDFQPESISGEFLTGAAHAFFPKELRWRTDAPDLYVMKTSKIIDARHGRFGFHGGGAVKNVQVGDRLAFDFRRAGAIRFVQCENVRIEGGAILAAPGVAVLCRYMKGENHFSYDIHPGPPPAGASEPRLLSSSADGFNYAYARRGPVLEGAHFSFMGDDSVNLHGPVFMVAEQVSERELIVGWLWNQEFLPWLIQPDDTMRRLKQGNFAILGESKIESFSVVRWPEARWVETVKQNWPRATEIKGIFRIRLKQPMQCKPGEAIDIPECNSPGFRIANCEFRDHRARGVRIESSEGVIEGNTFERIKQAGISLGPEYGFWREAGWVRDVTVRKNAFREVVLMPGIEERTAAIISIFANVEKPLPLEPGERGNERITIEGNTVEGSPAEKVRSAYAREVKSDW